jgi:CheY-like chemotaxis protein
MGDGTGPDTVEVLLVEDDQGDVVMITEASEQSGSPVHLNVVGDGELAMHFLRRAGAFADAPRPGLIVLDLNLPRRTGLEVLADLKADRDLLVIPVLILTASAAPADIQRSYSLHANAYIIKPADFDSFTDAINQIASWFLRLIKLPRTW